MPVPRPFEYYAPASIEEAVTLAAKNEDGKVIAGGQSLVPLMRFRLANPRVLIDIGRHLRREMSYVRGDGHGLSIGALTTHYELSTSPILKTMCPMLAKAAEDIGDYQVRNRGTIGGSLCHADPAAHYPPAILAFDAQLVARGRGGERTIGATDFFRDIFTTALAQDEILTEVRIPASSGANWGYEVIHGQGGSYATAVAAVLLHMEGSTCESASIAIGACSPVPVRLAEAEEVIAGQPLTDELIDQASHVVRSRLKEPLVDARVSVDHRLEMAALAIRRALLAAAGGV
jgi:carbon-monoxide dehydrogenase medium subunit